MRPTSEPPPFAVRTVGMIDRRPWHATPGTRADDWMLTVFLAGRGRYRNRAGTIVVEAGMLGLVPPDDPGILAADPADPYLHWYCRFNGGHARHLAAGILAVRGGIRFAPCTQVRAIAAALRPFGPMHLIDLPVRMGRPELALAGILVGLAEGPADAEPTVLDGDRLREHLQRHVDEPTDLGAIARHFGVSVRTLSRRCRARTGTSVQRLHERMKMDWAAELLAATDAPVAEIARRTGYPDAGYFSRVFRRHHRRAPSAGRDHPA